MDYFIYNGTILTMNDACPTPEAVYIHHNIIKAIGKISEIEPQLSKDCQYIDLKGNVLLPAFIDTHTHFYEYAKSIVAINLHNAHDLEEVRSCLVHYRNSHKVVEGWVRGSGWNKNVYPSIEGFNRYFLDNIFPDVPVVLESQDFHTKLCNSKALQLAGIHSMTLAPKGGEIGRFANGEPDGFLYESAWDLIEMVAPQDSEQFAKNAVIAAVQECYKLGLAGVHVMEYKPKWELYTSLIKKGLLFRFCWHFPSHDLDDMIAKKITSYTGDEFLKIGGMKIFMDGALGSQSAWMYEPYPGTTDYGKSILSEDQLVTLISKAAKNGISSSIHAIGDRCVHTVISAIDLVNKSVNCSLMHRIEHLQCIRPEDIPVLIEAKIYCALQPVHMKVDIPTIKRYWSSVEKYTYPFNTLLKAGLKPGFGSDAPVETISPFEGIYAALQRKYDNDSTNESWKPWERITLSDCLKAYTIWAAKASQSDSVRGSIELGKLADLIVLDDFIGKPDEFWLTAESKLTMIDGNIVWNCL